MKTDEFGNISREWFDSDEDWSKANQNRFSATNSGTPKTGGTMGQDPGRSKYEQWADVDPAKYSSMLGDDGKLKSPFAVDPNSSDAFSQMKGIATSADLSPWAKLQMQQNDLATSGQRDQANRQSLGQTQQGMQQMMATGGGGNSGASAFLAAQGGKNALMANQAIGAQAQTNALGIQSTDAQNKQTMLGQVANTETGAQAANAQTAAADNTASNLTNQQRYQQLMGAWAADRTGQAQASAAKGGKK